MGRAQQSHLHSCWLPYTGARYVLALALYTLSPMRQLAPLEDSHNRCLGPGKGGGSEEGIHPEEDEWMPAFCMVFPVKPGKAPAIKDFARETMGPRRREFEASEKRLGISKEAWFLQSSPQGDLVLLYV